MGLLFNCNDYKPEEKNTSVIQTPKKDRNLFGLYIPRGLTKTSENLTPGYVMFRPSNSASTYLVDREGKVVHEWKSNYGIHNFYLNADGSINVLASDPDFPVFAGGGEAGRLQKISWDSKVVWDFEYANEQHHAHHDISVMPNGNFLAIAWEAKTADEALKAGRKPDMIPKAGLWPSTIIEVQPNGNTGGDIVWEWHIWDHLIQDIDPEKDNYGEVALHPELLDINIGRKVPPPISQDSMDVLHASKIAFRNATVENRGSDVYHVNAIDYNPELDQIVFSSPQLNEIFIIDHSTTTEEAAGHKGGKYNRGGDFLYRWGKPENYRQADSTDQKLFGQHDVRWIDKGKIGADDLTVFNNQVPNGPDSLNYSAIYQITTPINKNGGYDLADNGSYGPETTSWEYVAKDTLSFYGGFVSGAHRMKNGNTFINEGPKGRFFEVNNEGDILWEFLNPYRGNIHHTDGDPVALFPLTYMQFRSTFIPADHPGLRGKELKPMEPQPGIFTLPPPPKENK
jgi:hypothetical protein